MTQSGRRQIEEHVESIWVVDTHEHMPSEKEWLSVPESTLDFSQLMHYVDLDLISAGMPPEDMRRVRFEEVPEDEKWALFEPFWEKARNTSYAKTVDAAVREFYGLPGLSRDTYREIGKRIREDRKPGRYRRVLKQNARIAVSILDTDDTEVDRDLFLPAVRLDHYMSIGGKTTLADFEQKHSREIGSLSDLAEAMTEAFGKAVEGGAVAIKSAQAYTRGLDYDFHTEEEAARAFDRAYRSDEEADPRDLKAVWDHLFHRLVQMCIEKRVPLQIHTGIAAGNATRLGPTNPLLLTDVLLRYPEGRFDLFHAGYPYCQEMGVLSKTFPGVRADLCWTHMISPAGARRALDEWLEIVPASKIFGFGGDLGSPEIAAAHLKLARRNIATVLADKVEDGYFTIGEARGIAEMLLRDNPAEFFDIDLSGRTE